MISLLNGSVGLSMGGNVVCQWEITVSESLPKHKGRDLLRSVWSLNESVSLGGHIFWAL